MDTSDSGCEENVWVHAGNLDWHAGADDVEQVLRSLLLSTLGSQDAIEVVDVQHFKAGKKRKPVDENKLHQGYALVKLATAACAATAIVALNGAVAGIGRHKDGKEGERLPLSAAPATARQEKSKDTLAKEAAAAAARQAEASVRCAASDLRLKRAAGH